MLDAQSFNKLYLTGLVAKAKYCENSVSNFTN